MRSIGTKQINNETHTRESILDRHKKLVYSVCKKYKGMAAAVGEDYEDIVSLGNIGLINAFDRFDGEKYSVKFSTYAVPLIAGEIQRHLLKADRGLHYSRGIKELATKIHYGDLIESPIEDIALRFDVGKDRVLHALEYIRHRTPRSTDQPIQTGEESQENPMI